MNGKDITVASVALSVAVGILEDLNFDSPNEGLAAGGDVIGPDEEAGIAFRNEVAPFHLHDEVLIHSIGSNLSNGLPRTDQVAFFVE